MKIRTFDRSPENVGRLWQKYWEQRDRFPAGDGNSMARFLEVIMAPTTEVFELGNFQGVLFFTDIVTPAEVGPNEETTAIPHVFFWDRRCYRAIEEIRACGRAFVRHYGIYRVNAESPIALRGMHKFLERIGFTRIGQRRARKRATDGQTGDTVLYELLATDLEEA